MADSRANAPNTPIPPGYIRCYLTGGLRRDTPEEHVRQRWGRSLVEEYGFRKADLGIEVPIRLGRARKRADLAVYRSGAPRTQENILILVEAKRDDRKPSDGQAGEEQLKSYMAACSSCRFGLWVGQERRAFELAAGRFEEIADIPRSGADHPTLPTHATLAPARELKSVFRRCHNYIYANAGLQKAEAFHELLKLIFCKTFDEEESVGPLRFAVDPRERSQTSGQRRLMEERLQPLFSRVRGRYPFIFSNTERIDLEPHVAAYVVSELQHLSVIYTDTDVKGDAYEELVGANLRGDRGEYFTPRNVCDLAVRMAMALHPETDLTSLKVLDCCCGTGGFLVSWLSNLHRALLRQEASRPLRDTPPEERARARVRQVCDTNLFGLDINPNLVRTCQMNLVLHGDGSSNVFRVDSVRRPGEWSDQARQRIPYGEIDVLFTNPPFGGRATIDDTHVLSQYELPGWEATKARSSMPAERLFVETALRFVKPGGYLAIVLPDGILNNPGLRYLRSWVLGRSRLIASVDLPKTTFAAGGGVNNPSLLLLQRYRETDGPPRRDYEVFMARPRTSGRDKRAKPIFLREPDGSERLDDDGDKVVDDEIALVAGAFRRFLQDGRSPGGAEMTAE